MRVCKGHQGCAQRHEGCARSMKIRCVTMPMTRVGWVELATSEMTDSGGVSKEISKSAAYAQNGSGITELRC